MRAKNKYTQKRVMIITLMILLFLLFIAMINWTINFSLFTFEDARLSIILLSCTGILMLIGHIDFRNINSLKKRIRFNLFFTAMVMSVLLLYNAFSTTVTIFSRRHMIIKPLLLAFLFYLPILNILERLKRNQTLMTRSKDLALSEAKNAIDNKQNKMSLPDLSRREREVFDLALYDLTNKEIAEKLFITEATVKKHMQSILKKIDCSTRKELITKYIFMR